LASKIITEADTAGTRFTFGTSSVKKLLRKTDLSRLRDYEAESSTRITSSTSSTIDSGCSVADGRLIAGFSAGLMIVALVSTVTAF
jgi:hypothetical protein